MYKKILVLLVFFALLSLCGCWDRLEPERRAIVIGGGFDYNPERELYQVIFQIVSPLIRQGQNTGGNEKPNYWTVSAWGHSLYDALANMSKKVSRRISFSHAQLYVFSERMARTKGVLPVVNAVARSRESRRIIILAVAKDNLEQMLTVNLPIESSNVMGLTNQIYLTMEEMGGTAVEDTRDFFTKLVQPGIEPHVVGLELSDPKNNGREEKTDPGIEPPIRIIGKYFFKDDHLIGLLNDRETRGSNWIIGNVRAGTLLVKYPDEQDVRVDVLISRGSSQIKPVIREGQPLIELKIKVSGHIVNITGTSGLKDESAVTKSLNQRVSQIVRNDVELALKKTQSNQCDIFGFGFAFYRLKYKEWLEMEDNWDEIFATIPVELTIEADIKNMGLVNKGPEIR